MLKNFYFVILILYKTNLKSQNLESLYRNENNLLIRNIYSNIFDKAIHTQYLF